MRLQFSIVLMVCWNLKSSNCQNAHKGNDVHVHLANDCEANDIFKSIPFHHVGPLVTTFLKSEPEHRSLAKLISSPYFTSLVAGVANAIENQHLFGFFAGVGEHVADFLDHFVGVSKSVRKPRESDEAPGFLGKFKSKPPVPENHIAKLIPLEFVGTVIRGLVRHLPSEKSKHCYYNRYEPVVQKMKAHVNSAEFKSFLGKVQQSYKPIQYQKPKQHKPEPEPPKKPNKKTKKRKFLNNI